MEIERKKLHQLKLTAAKMEIFFNLWIGWALAIGGAVIGSWIAGTAIDWVLTGVAAVGWAGLTAWLFKILLAGKQRVWEQEDRVERLKDAEQAFKGRGS